MDRRADVLARARIEERVRQALEMQGWDPERRAAWVDERLAEQVAAAGHEVRGGVRDALERLPLSTRANLRSHPEPGGLVVSRQTSGSTGRPVRAWHGPATVGWAAAGRLRQLTWFGLEPREHPQVNVRIAARADDPLLARDEREIPLWWLNPYRLDPAAADAVHGQLASEGVLLAGAESSMLARWADAAKAGECDPRELGLRLCIVGGEMTYPEQRRLGAETFGCAVAEMYGSHELSLIATECSGGSMHLIEEAVLVEILDEQGQPVADGTAGEVTVTLLHNSEMPLLRYRLGDVAAFQPGECGCGSTLRRLKVAIGRAEQMVRAPGGELLHPRFLRSIYERALGSDLTAFHTTQLSPGRFEVELDIDGDLSPELPAELAREIEAYLGAPVEVQVRRGPAAPPAGKLRTFTWKG